MVELQIPCQLLENHNGNEWEIYYCLLCNLKKKRIVFTINLNFDSIRKVKIMTILILHRRKMMKTDSARFQCLNIAGQFEISPSVSQ